MPHHGPEFDELLALQMQRAICAYHLFVSLHQACYSQPLLVSITEIPCMTIL